ncbi:hypothetical protein DU500_15800 [Haloplanus rubicundus]|uniref:Yip1 domain-containing protein n=1 Tax=Haloplanus rubicundus TaxID=1547898 RepID=A0A345E6F0_9EURY|nr:hypothetical protein [Haloplanus rubicundus]AXG07772.1 hypothetical protein DU500_15800 [Haloplanus rubicundus]
MPVPFVGALVTFVVSALVGGLAIYVGARVVADVDDYGRAVVTALLGALGWAVVSWLPLIGPVVALIVWIGVLKWRYPGGWGTAAVMGFVAWIAALVILFVVNAAFGVGIGAFGVPGA